MVRVAASRRPLTAIATGVETSANASSTPGSLGFPPNLRNPQSDTLYSHHPRGSREKGHKGVLEQLKISQDAPTTVNAASSVVPRQILNVMTPSLDSDTQRSQISSLRQRLDAALFEIKQHEIYARQQLDDFHALGAENLRLVSELRESQEASAMMQELLQWEKYVGPSVMASKGAVEQQLATLRGRALQHAAYEQDKLHEALLAKDYIIHHLQLKLQLARAEQESSVSAAGTEAERLRQELDHFASVFSAKNRQMSSLESTANTSSISLKAQLKEARDEVSDRDDKIELLYADVESLTGLQKRTLEKAKELDIELQQARSVIETLRGEQEPHRERARAAEEEVRTTQLVALGVRVYIYHSGSLPAAFQ